MSEKNDNWMNEIQKSDLDLGGLTMPEFDFDRVKQIRLQREAEQAEYKKKYGDTWHDKWWADKNPKPDYDQFLKSINTSIYEGRFMRLMGVGEEVAKRQKQVWDRMHEIYGNQYNKLEVHAPGDPRVIELLLQDALKTGKWNELPDCLQTEYHKQI